MARSSRDARYPCSQKPGREPPTTHRGESTYTSEMQKLITLVFLLGLILTSGANAASYQMIDGTIVDPIQSILGGDLAYSGANLEPDADLSGANLSYANLSYANLTVAVITAADLTGADLANANLLDAELQGTNGTNVNLTNANLRYAFLNDANLSGANLTDASNLGTTTGSAYYNAETDFTNAWNFAPGGVLFDPVAAGWNLIPEPSTALLLGIGLAGLGMRRRAH